MKSLLKVVFIVIFLNIFLFANSEISIQKDISLVGGEQNHEFTISSNFHKQEYLIQVYQPKSKALENGYPVVYILDGNATFPYASVMAQAMDNMSYRTKKVPPLIVSIGYASKELFDIEARSSDYTPPYEGELKTPQNRGSSQFTQGGAEEFYSFIQKQLKPIIEKNYKVDKHKQTLFGHSYGGLFTLYSFLNHPNDFQNFIAASPSIWWNDSLILKNLKDNIEFKNPTNLILSVGEIENKGKNPTDIDIFASYFKNSVNLQTKVLNIQNASHLEALFPALNQIFKIEQ
ncbi:alpha/beta hydrolase [Aliarcobacter vitoriensis]|uniref:alpha/beta hydrolase n=2 Tax=Aliarcobacter TaxID=2321111 RepID=UPI003AAEF560